MPGEQSGKPPPTPPKRVVKSARDPALAGVNPAVEPFDPPEESAAFPIVGIGASAGGLEALRQFLSHLPADTGMAFVIVQHLDPTHQSMLPEILARATSMPVQEVADNARVEPQRVYVIPPGKLLVIGEGLLQLSPRTVVRGIPRPFDHFLRSLAEEMGHKAIGVVLSGTGSDGTLGLEEVKAAGGITFAQDDTAEQTSMPRSAVAAGCIDLVLPAADIAREIGRISRHPYVKPPAETLEVPHAGTWHRAGGRSTAARHRGGFRALQVQHAAAAHHPPHAAAPAGRSARLRPHAASRIPPRSTRSIPTSSSTSPASSATRSHMKR